MAPRVVITGMGAVTPCGLNAPSTWDAMVNARSGLGLLTRFDASEWPSRVAGEVKGFDGAEAIGARAIRRLGLFTQFALVACAEALDDAGFTKDVGVWPAAERFGIYISSGIGGLPEMVDSERSVAAHGRKGLSPFVIPRVLPNLAAGQVAIHYGAKGPSLSISTACAAGNHAIGEAWRAIRDGDADVIIAGGAEAGLTEIGFGGFMAMHAMSKRNDEPEKASRPFDRERDGFVMSEGSGVIVLETLEHALARNARIYAELTGYGVSTDAHHVTAPAPGGEGAVRAMRMALAKANTPPEAVEYINAHGTSTAQNDVTETTAIRTVFGEYADRIPVSSTKGVTGHLLGAAGGVEAIAAVMALHTGIVPPTANLENPDPECDLDYVPLTARRCNPRVALSNGFGFGGTNATLVFHRWEGE